MWRYFWVRKTVSLISEIMGLVPSSENMVGFGLLCLTSKDSAHGGGSTNGKELEKLL